MLEPLFIDRLFGESVTSHSKMTSGIVGSLSTFDSSEESWSSYIERFELFVDCNDIKTEKKVSTLLTVMGVKTYNLLKDLCTPDKPSSKSYETIVKIVGEHLNPKPSFIVERYKFSLRNQNEHETIAEYVVQLKKLSTHCNFQDKLPDYLRDRLVSGIRSDNIKKRLLSEVNLTFETALQLTTSLEAADRDSHTITYQGPSRLHTCTARNQRQRNVQHQGKEERVSSVSDKVQCFCCGKMGHYTKQCKFRSYHCNFCKKQGHLERACKSKLQKGKPTSNGFSYKSSCNQKQKFSKTANSNRNFLSSHLQKRG